MQLFSQNSKLVEVKQNLSSTQCYFLFTKGPVTVMGEELQSQGIELCKVEAIHANVAIFATPKCTIQLTAASKSAFCGDVDRSRQQVKE